MPDLVPTSNDRAVVDLIERKLAPVTQPTARRYRDDVVLAYQMSGRLKGKPQHQALVERAAEAYDWVLQLVPHTVHRPSDD